MKKLFIISLFATLLFGTTAFAEVSCQKAGQENLQALMACIGSNQAPSNGPHHVKMVNRLARFKTPPHPHPVVPIGNLLADVLIGGRYSYARFIPLAYPYGFTTNYYPRY